MFRVEIQGTVDPNSTVLIHLGLSHFYKSFEDVDKKLKDLERYPNKLLNEQFKIYTFENRPYITHYDLI